MEYKILTNENPSTLAKEVNKKLAQGWQLWGGVSACYSANGEYLNHVFAQAIIRKTSRGGKVLAKTSKSDSGNLSNL